MDNINKTDIYSSSPVNSSFPKHLQNSTNSTKCDIDKNAQDLPPLKQNNVCSVCNKKTGLATSFKCKCGLNNCSIHRYSNAHICTYDWVAEKKEQLTKSNPVVVADKISKIL